MIALSNYPPRAYSLLASRPQRARGCASRQRGAATMASSSKYQRGVSTAKPCVPNSGAPVQGKPVAWAKGLATQRLIRVHMQGAGGLTVCRALNTDNSPYLGTGGHVAYATTAKVTCKPCGVAMATARAQAAKAARNAKATAPATAKATATTPAPATAPAPAPAS